MLDPAAVEAWSTFALAVLALFALRVAGGQIREARELRRATHRAYVTIHVEGDKATRALNLVLENTGLSTAENVAVTFSPPLQAAHGSVDPTESEPVWSQPSMPPRKVIRTVLDHGPERIESDLPMAFDAHVTYDSPTTGEIKLSQTYRLDLRASAYAIRQWDLVDRDTPNRTKALESIAASMKKIAGE